jgi:hypothetical protein
MDIRQFRQSDRQYYSGLLHSNQHLQDDTVTPTHQLESEIWKSRSLIPGAKLPERCYHKQVLSLSCSIQAEGDVE